MSDAITAIAVYVMQGQELPPALTADLALATLLRMTALAGGRHPTADEQCHMAIEVMMLAFVMTQGMQDAAMVREVARMLTDKLEEVARDRESEPGDGVH